MGKNLSKNVIGNEESREDVSIWDLPIVSEGDIPTVIAAKTEILLPTAEDVEKIQEQAYKEAYDQAFEKATQEGIAQGIEQGIKQGFDKGKAEGYAHGMAEGQEVINEKSSHLSDIISVLSAPLSHLDEVVEQELISLVMMVARQLIRRELRIEPSHVIAAVREAVELLPVSTQNIRVMLHPEDAILVRESLSVSDDDEQRWKIVEDPMLSRGGCSVETEYSRIDASIESRINNVIAQVLGDERMSEANAKPSG